MNSKDVAELTGVSVRTLHHYDDIGLVSPKRSDNGYREYSGADLARLQQVLAFKRCGFSLEQIAKMLGNPDFDRKKAFALQKKMLLCQRDGIDRMIAALERGVKTEKVENDMEVTNMFDGFNFDNNPYEDEARELYGDEAVDRSNAHIGAMSKEERAGAGERMGELFSSLAGVMGRDPATEEVQQKIKELFDFFNGGFGVTYTPEMFAGLGEMYVEDERFTKNIDAYGEGLSEFLKKAMRVFADGKKD